jgi:hypothetical protein
VFGRLRTFLATPDINGELPTVDEAVERTIDVMVDLYVSPAVVPKVGGLKRLGLTTDQVTREESTGWKLVATELPS